MGWHGGKYCVLVGLSLVVGLVMAKPLCGQEMRTWSDITGKFKIEAKFVEIKDKKVLLEKENGQTLEIPLLMLSPEDRKHVSETDANPFKVVEPSRPAMRAKPTESAGTDIDFGIPYNGINWSKAQTIDLSTYSSQWDLSGQEAYEQSDKMASIPLGKPRDFFEKVTGFATSAVSDTGVVGYAWTFGSRNKGPETRLLNFDLKSGKLKQELVVPSAYVPLAVHPDGRTLVMVAEGNDRNKDSEFWYINDDNEVKREKFVWKNPTWPNNARGGSLEWAHFADAQTLITKSSGDWIVVWDYAKKQPVCQFQTDAFCFPAISPDGKTLAFHHDEHVALFGITERDVIAKQKTGKLAFARFGFSPTGLRLACQAHSKIAIWDLKTGELYREHDLSGHSSGIDPLFTEEEFLLVGGKYLLDLENMVNLWEYQGATLTEQVGATPYLVVAQTNSPGALIVADIPHPEALQALEMALTQPDLFAFRPGISVKMEINGIPANQRDEIETSLKTALANADVTVDSNADVTLRVRVEGPTSKQISYTRSGTHTVQQYLTILELVYESKVIWSQTSNNIPGFVMVRGDQTIEGILREASKGPSLGHLKNVTFPKLIQKPNANSASNSYSGKSLGMTKINPAGQQGSRSPRGRR